MGWGGKLTASWRSSSTGAGGLRSGGRGSDNRFAALDALLVGQVGGGLAVTLGACGLAVVDGVHGVGEELAIGAAGVVAGGACEVVRIAAESARGGLKAYNSRGRWRQPAGLR